MKNFFTTLAAVLIGGVMLFVLPFILLIIIGLASGGDKTVAIDDNSVIVYDLSTSVVDRDVEDPMNGINALLGEGVGSQIALLDFCNAIDHAAKDEKIKGLILMGTSSNTSMEVMKEIRPHVAKFKESGKFIYYFDEGIDQSSLYIASLADGVYVMPEGYVSITGLHTVKEFYKNAFDKFGIDMQVVRHGKYKSAVEPYITDHMSEASKEQTLRYMNILWDEMASGIAEGRGIDKSVVNEYASSYDTYTTAKALEANLIDSLIFKDQFLALQKEKLGIEEKEDIKSISIESYAKNYEKELNDSEDKIAVIYAGGEINNGSNQADPSNIYGDDLAYTIRQARRDEKVKAIVLRVNSPGGAVNASEIIWREVSVAAEKLPVIVSMGQYAASGGYYISCPSDRIFAEPNTITGSIGIFGVIPCAQKLANSVGLTFEQVYTNQPTMTQFTLMDQQQREYMQNSIEHGYDTFITHVANGRGMSKEKVDSIGQGRVWAGTDALEIGLVDEIGSLEDAIAYAAKEAGLESYKLQTLPETEDSFSALMKKMGMGAKAFVGESLFGEDYAAIQRVKKEIKEPSLQARMESCIMLK